MPEDLDPTTVLRDVDHPRSLSPELHQRLTDQLLSAAGETTRVLPLAPEFSARLSGELLDAAGDVDGANRRAGGVLQELRSRWTIGTSAAAAVVLLLAAVAGIVFHPGIVKPTHPSTTASGAARSASLAPGSALSPTAGAFSAATGSSSTSSAPAPGTPAANSTAGAGSGTATGSAGSSGGVSGGATAAAAPATPMVSSISPATGPVTGGTTVTITGQGLGDVTAVHFGPDSASQVQVISPTEVTAVSPAHLPGSVDVEVVTPEGLSPASSADTFTYTAA